MMLTSKLHPPRLPRLFTRPRLTSIPSAMIRHRLTLVVAGAGYGKTCLIAEAVRNQPFAAVWYSLDEADQDFVTFIQYAAKGFEPFVPQGLSALNSGEMGRNPSEKMRFEIIKKLIHDIERIPEDDMVWVLDDFHLIQINPHICRAVEFLLKHLPPRIHVVIISRAVPKLRISRWRLSDQVVDISEVDLAFTSEETAAIYSRMFHLSLSETTLMQLHAKTNGWIAGLILFYLSSKDKHEAEIESFLEKLGGSPRLIFDYLEENLFTCQPAHIQEFLLKTAPLEFIDPDFCNAYLGIHESYSVLESIADNHLMIHQKAPEGFFYYHYLLREFLLAKLAQKSDGKVIGDLYFEIAQLFECRGDELTAVQYYLNGNHASIAAGRIFRLEVVFPFVISLYSSFLLHLIVLLSVVLSQCVTCYKR